MPSWPVSPRTASPGSRRSRRSTAGRPCATSWPAASRLRGLRRRLRLHEVAADDQRQRARRHLGKPLDATQVRRTDERPRRGVLDHARREDRALSPVPQASQRRGRHARTTGGRRGPALPRPLPRGLRHAWRCADRRALLRALRDRARRPRRDPALAPVVQAGRDGPGLADPLLDDPPSSRGASARSAQPLTMPRARSASMPAAS